MWRGSQSVSYGQVAQSQREKGQEPGELGPVVRICQLQNIIPGFGGLSP